VCCNHSTLNRSLFGTVAFDRELLNSIHNTRNVIIREKKEKRNESRLMISTSTWNWSLRDSLGFTQSTIDIILPSRCGCYFDASISTEILSSFLVRLQAYTAMHRTEEKSVNLQDLLWHQQKDADDWHQRPHYCQIVSTRLGEVLCVSWVLRTAIGRLGVRYLYSQFERMGQPMMAPLCLLT
jgi:hypothetical protein